MTVGEGIQARPGERSAMARLRASAIVLAFLALVALGAPQLPPYYLRIADNVLIYLILAMGLNMVVGYAGLLDLGFIAFYAIGAYSYAILASGQFDIHLPFVAVFLVGGGLAALSGVLLGIPVLRLRGDYLAIVTLGFGEIIRLVINNLDWLTNGPQGISRIDRPEFLGLVLQSPRDFFYFLLCLAIVAFAFVWRLECSIPGRGARYRSRYYGSQTCRIRSERHDWRLRGRGVQRLPALCEPRKFYFLGIAHRGVDHCGRRPWQSRRHHCRRVDAGGHTRTSA
jgi:hypothetical protein